MIMPSKIYFVLFCMTVVSAAFCSCDDNLIELNAVSADSRLGEDYIPDDFEKTYGVGWGYDCNTYIGDVRGIKEQIFSARKIKKFANDVDYSGNLFVEDEPYELLASSEYIGTSSTEYSESMAASASVSVGIPYAFSMDVSARFSQSDMESGESFFATKRRKKIIRKRNMDVGNVMALVQDGKDVFTDAFKDYVQRLRGNNDFAIKDFVNTFGNAFVYTAEIGGRIDCDMTINKTASISKNEISVSLEANFLSMFGMSLNEKQQEVNQKTKEYTKSNLSVRGGDVTILGATLLNGEQCDSTTLVRWDESVTLENAQMIDCKLCPIWELITDAEVKAKVKSYITGERIEECDYSFPEPTISYFKIEVPEFSEEGTLVKVVWANGRPVAEFCRELVPVITPYERVTVAYPVVNNKPVYSRGVFVGNGGRFPPGEIVWSDGKAYYYSVSDMADREQVNDVFVEGSSLSLVPAEGIKYGKSESARDIFITYDNKLYRQVKIGENVWSRDFHNSTKCHDEGKLESDCYSQVDGICLYKSGYADDVIPVNWRLPMESDINGLNALCNTGEPYIGQGVSGLDIYSVVKDEEGEASVYIMADRADCRVRFTPMDAVRMDTGGYNQVAVRVVRSSSFRYH